jgi:ABC-2 type transport system permease protein
MGRYWQLLRLFVSTAIAAEMEYRGNFLLAALTSLGGAITSWFGLFLFYRTGYTFQDWNWNEALLVMGIFLLLQGFSTACMVPNLNSIVKQVETGTLDFVLLKPISTQFWLSTRTISLWGLPDIALGLGVIFYAGWLLHLAWWNYLFAALPLLLGAVILYSLWFVLGATSIWFTKIYNITEVLRGLLEAGRYPMTAYPAAFQFFFTFVVPVLFMTTIPAEIALGRNVWPWVGLSAILAIALLYLSNQFWRFALRFYTSASS